MTTATQTTATSKAPSRKSVGKASASPAKSSKTEQARAIFLTMTKAGKSRKEILERFVEEVNLTKSGAGTYYQNFLTEQKHGGKAIVMHDKPQTPAAQRGRPLDEKSKAGIARNIFSKMKNAPRKEVLAAFIKKANLTPAGASTYYQMQRRAA